MPFFFVFIFLIFSSCQHFLPSPPCCPPSVRKPHTPTFSCDGLCVCPILPDPLEPLCLSELVDLALLNSPKTRGAWYFAKQAAADVGIARGAYLPTLFLEGSWLKDQYLDIDFNIPYLTRENRFTASLSTSYLIFDFGKRNADLMEALYALDSLNWALNWQIQSVMIQTIRCYYNYVNAAGHVEADQAAVKEGEEILSRAEKLKGDKSIKHSDQLLVKTGLIQAKINYQLSLEALNLAKVCLAQSLSLSPDTPLCISCPPQEIEVDGICQDMTSLLKLAKENRSDLKAYRSQVMGNFAHVAGARSQMLPSLVADASYGKQSLNETSFRNIYSLGCSLGVPLFNGFADVNELRKAEYALLSSQANLDDEELSAYLLVLSDYYNLISSSKILQYSKTLLETSKSCYQAENSNCEDDATAIVDLMTASASLRAARIQLIDAQTNFLTAVANLSYHTGSLKMPCNPMLQTSK